MTSPRTITLFEEHPDLRGPQASFAASILIHGAFIALIAFAILYTPQIDRRAAREHYIVRQLDMLTPDKPEHRSAADAIAYPGPWPHDRASASSGRLAAASAEALALPRIPRVKHGPQTLVQPDLHSDLTLQQITPVPQVVLWTPARTPVAKIVAPLPAKPPTANVTPTLQSPNQETNLADIALSAATQPSLRQLMVPSTTTPLVVRGPKPTPSTPATVSQPVAQPTPAAVVSLSDVRMKNGTVALPPANESAATDAAGAFSLSPGQAQAPSPPGDSNPADKSSANGPDTARNGAGKSTDNHAGATARGGEGNNSPVAGSGQTPGLQAQGSNNGQNLGDPHSVTQITLPKDGHFGAVVVGASIEDEFPEVSDVWKGRMAYTVYLHVGLEKSWILQYSLPRSAVAEEAGAIAHLEAPWPYNIVRPNLDPGAIDTDTLMIHGYVNDSGRFETLSIVFPPQFPQAKFVLDSLERWQFRPASQNGQVARVEVLLIIPEEFE